MTSAIGYDREIVWRLKVWITHIQGCWWSWSQETKIHGSLIVGPPIEASNASVNEQETWTERVKYNEMVGEEQPPNE